MRIIDFDSEPILHKHMFPQMHSMNDPNQSYVGHYGPIALQGAPTFFSTTEHTFTQSYHPKLLLLWFQVLCI